jgi:Ca2+-binding EF-hand superfamily protein
MNKGIIEFDLTSYDDRDSMQRALKVNDLCSVLFRLVFQTDPPDNQTEEFYKGFECFDKNVRDLIESHNLWEILE